MGGDRATDWLKDCGSRAERVIIEGGAFVGSECGQGGRRGGKVHIWAGIGLRLGCEIVGLSAEKEITRGPFVG